MKSTMLTIVAITLLACTPASSTEAPRPAVWAEHDTTIELQNLPVAYTCDDLKMKIHDVLQAIGARADMRIFVTRCASGMDTRIVAPRAHLIFSLPFAFGDSLAGSADLLVIERNVRVEPGNPPSIDSSDCELIRQLEPTLFEAVSMRVEADRLTCHSLAARHTFGLSIKTMMPSASVPSQMSRTRDARGAVLRSR